MFPALNFRVFLDLINLDKLYYDAIKNTIINLAGIIHNDKCEHMPLKYYYALTGADKSSNIGLEPLSAPQAA